MSTNVRGVAWMVYDVTDTALGHQGTASALGHQGTAMAQNGVKVKK